MSNVQTDAVAALAALGQSTRLELFQTLVNAGAEGLSAGAIARQLGVRQNTLSGHLGILERAGMITHRRSGRSLIYRHSFFGMRTLLKFLVTDCCNNHPAVCKPLIAQLERAAQPGPSTEKEVTPKEATPIEATPA